MRRVRYALPGAYNTGKFDKNRPPEQAFSNGPVKGRGEYLTKNGCLRPKHRLERTRTRRPGCRVKGSVPGHRKPGPGAGQAHRCRLGWQARKGEPARGSRHEQEWGSVPYPVLGTADEFEPGRLQRIALLPELLPVDGRIELHRSASFDESEQFSIEQLVVFTLERFG